METALIIPVAAAEPVVGAFREQLDLSAPFGVPAHLTVLFPFLEAAQIDQAALAALIASHDSFTFTLSRTGWFGQTVLYLAPEPDAPFRALTQAVWQRYPQCPPYGGAYDDVVPHLTIGHDQPLDTLRTAEQTVAAALPIDATATSVRLLGRLDSTSAWQPLQDFPLGASQTNSHGQSTSSRLPA
jgi:2'-5' RNA ligase